MVSFRSTTPGALGVLSVLWSLSCKMLQQALPPSVKGALIRGQQWQPKVISTPTILLFQMRLPFIGARHIPSRQLHSRLLYWLVQRARKRKSLWC